LPTISTRDLGKLGIRCRVVPVVTAAIIRPRKQRFARGQFDPDAAADLTPEQLDYAQAAIRCQQLNGVLALSFSQQHAVMVSLGYRRNAEAGPLPKFETGAGRPREKP
jgi:hypothetical protein